MKTAPLPIIIVSIVFILTGAVGFIYHFKELAELSTRTETIWILFLRILAIVCGILLLYKVNWARWLAIAWLAYHVVIGALHSTSEMIAHVVFLIGISVLLFLPVSSAFFLRKNKDNPADRNRQP